MAPDMLSSSSLSLQGCRAVLAKMVAVLLVVQQDGRLVVLLLPLSCRDTTG
jgi:hypothetical protein